MPNRIAGVMAGAVALTVALTGTVVADSVDADADIVISGTQSLINLGTVAPGSTHTVEIGFDLVCKGLSHVPVGTTVALTPTTTPPVGGTMAATQAIVGPVPPTWPAAGQPCIDDPVLPGLSRSKITLTAPNVAGSNIVYRVTYAKAPTGGTSGGTLAQILLSVSANAAPELDLPADLTVEADRAGGWVADYVAGATDVEDDPDPVAACDPATGALLPVGTTTVDCQATDSAGATATGSFQIHVVDTTPPELGTLPAPSATTTDPDGAVVTWESPTASDVADPSPTVGCVRESGATFTVGTTTVTCTATDASGNSASATFPVVVTLETTPEPDPVPDPAPDPEPDPAPDPVPPGPPAPPVSDLSVVWHRPLGHEWTVARRGRSIPVKVGVRVDGSRLVPTPEDPRPTLRADRLDACGGDAGVADSVRLGPMRRVGGRWMLILRTRHLEAGCWSLVVEVDGSAAGDTGLRLVDSRHGGHRGHRGHGGHRAN